MPLLAVSASGLPNVAFNFNDTEKENYFREKGNYRAKELDIFSLGKKTVSYDPFLTHKLPTNVRLV